MKQNREYIVKDRNSDHRKIKVLEVTKETYYLHNLDADIKFRISKKKFEEGYVVVEELDPKPYPYDLGDWWPGIPTIPVVGITNPDTDNALKKHWLNITGSGTIAKRDITINTGKGGAILQQELLLGRFLTQEERDKFKDGVYKLSTSGTKYLGEYE